MGLSSSSEYFQKRMSQITEGIERVLRQTDDILVYGRKRKEHDSRLETVLGRLEEANLTLNMTEQLLFGGAFSVLLPENRHDLSAVRQIPDNQEVFAHPKTDQSIIIELMEAVDAQQPDEVAIQTHFDDLATVNGAAGDSNILHMEQIDRTNIALDEASSCWYFVGEQNIAKFNEVVKNTVDLHMGLFRVPRYSTDILVTFNDPINIDVASSSHHAVPTSVVRWNTEDFRRVLSSLKLLDPGIFGI